MSVHRRSGGDETESGFMRYDFVASMCLLFNPKEIDI